MNKRIINALCAFVLLSLLCACSKAEERRQSVTAEDVSRGLVIVNSLAETLSVLDGRGRIHTDVQVTGASPNAVISDESYLYVVNSLSNSIEVLKAGNLEMVSEISVGAGKNPMAAAVIRPGLIAVTAFLSQSLEIVDIKAKKVVRSIDLKDIDLPRDSAGVGGRSYPYGVAVAGGRIFVTLANLTDAYGGLTAAGAGVVVVLDAESYEVLSNVELSGADPVAALVYGDLVYIACAGHYDGDITKRKAQGFQGDGTIECIDVQSLGHTATTYYLTAAPFALSLSEEGILYTSNAMAGDIPRIDLATGKISYIATGGAFISSVLCVGEDLHALDFAEDKLLIIGVSGTVKSRYSVGDGPIAMLSLADVAAEGFITAVMTVYPAIASQGTTITFDASESLASDSVSGCAWDFGDGETAAGWTVTHAYQTLGEYPVTLTINSAHGEASAASTVRIVPVSPFAVRVIDYIPAAGQFTDNPRYANPLKALGPPAGGTSPYQPDTSSVVSLGGFGGSITLAFDHEVKDNPDALDFIVFGNAQYDQAPLRFIEPGLVEISPDGVTWYLIPGSDSGVNTTNHELPADLVDALADGVYALWGYADLSPVLALPEGADPLVYFTAPDDPFTPGIDAGTPGGDAFDIAWALDPLTGEPAGLSGFSYIRITTAMDAVHGGALGEISTEIDAVADVGLEEVN
ncbi:MAG: PKD domain-containing protein [Syntrophaceae bacterium]